VDAGSPAMGRATEPEAVEPAQRGWFDRSYAALRRINSAMTTLAALAIVIIMLLTLWEVFTRYFLRQPATWTLPISSYLLLVVIYFATSYVLQRGDHVRIDFVVDMLSPRTRARLEIVSAVLSLVFVAFFLWIVSQRAGRIFERWERDSSTLNVPLVIPAAIMVIGMLFMTLTAICGVVDRARHPERFARGKDLPELAVD
jgi:TRAP-type C4-dicarboxylate transport system permease small subunit